MRNFFGEYTYNLHFFMYDAVPPVIHNFLYKTSVKHGNE